MIGYSELDITLCHIGGLALDQKWTVLDALHSVENEGARLELVNKLARHILAEKSMGAKFGEAIGAMRYCKSARNQYAHAHWMVDEHKKLHFASSRSIEWTQNGSISWNGIDVTLLLEQLAYFEYTRRCLMWFEWKLLNPTQNRPFPSHTPQPPRHTPV